MGPDEYPDWQEAVERIAAAGGLALVIGDTDTGKTTFCTLVANAALALGKRVAVVDADVGQSEIGPPTCVGCGAVTEPLRALADVAPASLAFVGATSPRGRLLELAMATRLMADAARSGGPDLIVVDTTGFVRGASACRLKQAKITLLAPDHVVAIQRKAECEPILAPLRFGDPARVSRLPVPGAVRKKPPSFRTQRRVSRFVRYFEGAELRQYDFDQVVMTDTWLGSGQPVAPHLVKFLSNALRVRVYYAEQADRHLAMVTSAQPAGEEGYGVAQEQFRCEAITVTPAARLHHLVVGLQDGSGRLLGIGLIESIDLRRRSIGILTPIRAAASVRLVQFGILRVKRDGAELGVIRPGDV